MRTSTLTSTLVACVCIAAPAFAQQGNAPACPHIFVSSLEEGGKDKSGTRFSVTKTVDLTFAVLLPSEAAGEHLLQLKVYLPSGDLYQVIDVPVAASGTSAQDAAKGRTMRGYRHPVPKTVPSRQNVSGQDFNRVEVPFPVAGTAIVHASMFGAFRVEAYLDDSKQACGPAAGFQLVQ